jgi:hypothetical protein
LNNWFKGQTIIVTDYNDITTTGFYKLETTTNTKNTPIANIPGRWYIAIIIRSVNNEILQIVYNAEYTSHLYRYRNNIGSWSAWVQVK